jgi:hypothetical protein
MDYCENELGLNYKRCQRSIDIAQYKEAIPVDKVETLSGAIQIANTAKKEEKKARDEKEQKMFIKYTPKYLEYQSEIDEAEDAKAKASIKKPKEPWASEEDARNISNRFKSWLRKEEKRLEEESAKDADGREEVVDFYMVIEDAYQSAMLVIGRLDPYEQDGAVDALIVRLERGDSLI